VYHFKATFIVV